MNQSFGTRQSRVGAEVGRSSGSFRAQFSVLGPLHAGFGFGPSRIVEHSKEVARKRSEDAEVNRQLASQTPLHTDSHLQAVRYQQPAGYSASSVRENLTRFDVKKAPVFNPTSSSRSLAKDSVTESLAGSEPWVSFPMPVIELESSAKSQNGERPGPAGQPNVIRTGLSSKRALKDGRKQNSLAKSKIHSQEGSDFGTSQMTGLSRKERTTGQALGARGTIGRKPDRFAALMGVFVDSALCFSILALVNLMAHLSAWASHVQPFFRGVLHSMVGFLTSFLSSSSSAFEWMRDVELVPLHWALVIVVWGVAVFLLQCFCMLSFRSSFGRGLVGISVNPVASRRKGTFLVPLVEVLTCGGIFCFPLVLLAPDRHLFIPSLRFHVGTGLPHRMAPAPTHFQIPVLDSTDTSQV